MRGQPVLLTVLMVVSFLLAAWPVWCLTQPRRIVSSLATDHARPAESAAESDKKNVRVLIRWAHEPRSVELRAGDLTLWEKSDSTPAESPVEISLALPWSDGLMEWDLRAQWPDNTPETPITLTVEPDGLSSREITLWSVDQQLDDIVEFSWKGNPAP